MPAAVKRRSPVKRKTSPKRRSPVKRKTSPKRRRKTSRKRLNPPPYNNRQYKDYLTRRVDEKGHDNLTTYLRKVNLGSSIRNYDSGQMMALLTNIGKIIKRNNPSIGYTDTDYLEGVRYLDSLISREESERTAYRARTERELQNVRRVQAALREERGSQRQLTPDQRYRRDQADIARMSREMKEAELNQELQRLRGVR